MFGIYIHIPFCQSRCIYCDFVSSTLGQQWQLGYVDALEREMLERRGEIDNKEARARTIYIGGGTPSQLSPQALYRLMEALGKHFTWAEDAEFTLEANPDDITPEFVGLLRDTPVNRLSMGVQSTDDQMLRFLRRRHTARQALEAIERLQDAGYDNLSADLIYGLPGQRLKAFESDLRTLLQTGIPHLSAYALQYEPGTALHAMLERGEIPPEDEEHSLRCYERLRALTTEAGLEHYEISNFARPGRHSRHNSSYWLGTPYLGLGAGAHSYDGLARRRANTSDIRAYIAGQNDYEEETLTLEQRYDERIMLGLRTRWGVSLEALERDFGPALRRHCERMALPYLSEGMLTKKGEHLVLAPKALFVSDGIIAQLMSD